jgi:RNA-directed DNA polymerase
VVEEKRVPRAVTRRRTAIYAQDVLRCRSGYRPPVGALDAGETWTSKLPWGRDNGVVAADIPGCFDHLDPAWILRRLAERLEERALLRLIKPWRKAGGRDTDGTGRPPTTGSPQGGVGSPILAHLSLP